MERVNEHDLEYRDGASGIKYLMRGPRIDWGRWKLMPGESLGAHLHDEVEETFYFMAGEPTMIVGGKSLRVRRGDAVRAEPGEAHDIVNDTDAPVEGIFIKSAYRPKDKRAAPEGGAS